MAFRDLLAGLLGSQPAPSAGFVAGENELATAPPPPNWLQDESNIFHQPAATATIPYTGIPLLPLLAGVGGAFLNRATADKRVRNQAMGQGFGAMYGMLNTPIERERAEQQKIQDFMLKNNLAIPYDPYGGGAGGAVTLPAVPVAPGLGVPSLAATGVTPQGAIARANLEPSGAIAGPFQTLDGPGGAVPSAVRPGPRGRVLFKAGNRPMYDNTVSLSELGLTVPPGMPDRRVPMTPELAIAAAKERELGDYYHGHGAPADAPLKIAEALYQQKQDEATYDANQAKYAPTGPDISKVVRLGKGGSPTAEWTQASPDQTQALADVRATAKRTQDEYDYGLGQRALGRTEAAKRNISPTMPDALANEQIKEDVIAKRTEELEKKLPYTSGTSEQRRIVNGQQQIQTDTKSANEIQQQDIDNKFKATEAAARLGQLQLQQQEINAKLANMGVDKLRLEQTGALQQMEQLNRTITALSGVGMDARSPELARAKEEYDRQVFKVYAIDKRLEKGDPLDDPVDKPADAEARRAKAYIDKYKTDLFASKADFSKIALLPKPTDPILARARGIVLDRAQRVLDELVPQIEELASRQKGIFGGGDLTREQIDAMRASMPEGQFDFAYNQWKQGYYKPIQGPHIPALPKSALPPLPATPAH